MLHDYLEKSVQNKLNILYVIHTRGSVSGRQLSEILDLSMSGVALLVNEINTQLKGYASIVNTASNLSLQYQNNSNLTSLVHIICHSSNILKCLAFYIGNNNCQPFSAFYDKYFISQANAYRIRQSCKDYLRSIDLDLCQNTVCGEEYRIRFLIALLHYKYGINCCNITERDITTVRRYILSTNHCIDQKYLQHMQIEYGYFEDLFILSWKRKQFDIKMPHNSQLEKLKNVFIYQKMKETVRNSLEKEVGITFSEDDLDYMYLVYCSTNSCLFADQWKKADIQLVHDAVFSDQLFVNLMMRVEKVFGKEVAQSHPIRVTFIYFYKKTLYGLCCLIPDEHFYMDANHRTSTQILYQLLSDMIGSWKEENRLKNAIDRTHIYYLTLQIEFILRSKLAKVPMYVISDQNGELEVMHFTMEHYFASRCREIRPLLINAQNISFLYSQNTCVIILEKKFECIVEQHMHTDSKRRIISLTVEKGRREIRMIEDAISACEEEIFQDYLHSIYA